MSPLGVVFSAIDSMRQKAADAFANPWLTLQNAVAERNQRAGEHLADLRASPGPGQRATPEGLAAKERVLETLMGAYNPAGIVVRSTAGPLAERAATTMKNAGASPGRILQSTGLDEVPMPAGSAPVWGQQLNPLQAKLDLDAYKQLTSVFQQKPTPLAELLHFPDLYKLYPELEKLPTNRVSGFGMLAGVRGGFVSGPKSRMEVTGFNEYMQEPRHIARQTQEATSILLHELQHAVQAAEGWPRGGNSQEFALPSTARAKLAAEKLSRELEDVAKLHMKEVLGRDPIYSLGSVVRTMQNPSPWQQKLTEEANALALSPKLQEILAGYERLQGVNSRIADRDARAFLNYQNLAGEAQARAAQAVFQSNLNSRNPILGFYDTPLDKLFFKPQE